MNYNYMFVLNGFNFKLKIEDDKFNEDFKYNSNIKNGMEIKENKL